jgi:hypothetical protein
VVQAHIFIFLYRRWTHICQRFCALALRRTHSLNPTWRFRTRSPEERQQTASYHQFP